MKTIQLTLFLTFFVFLNSIAQNYIYKGSQQFPATPSWEFYCEASQLPYLEVQIAKTSTGGYLMISVDIHGSDNWEFIGGSAYVYLEDGSVITCIDKGIKDNVNNKSIALYTFTQAEMDKLKKSDIAQIRYSIKSKPGVMGTFAGNYTAKNTKMYLVLQSKEKNYFETSIAVANLY